MQYVSSGDILHEMSKPIFLEKHKKNIRMSSAGFVQGVVIVNVTNDDRGDLLLVK